MNIGPVIRSFRLHQNLTLEALAEMMEMSVSHLSLIERSKREPSLDSLSQIGQALNVPPSVIVLLATDSEENSDDELTRKLRNLIKEVLRNDDRFPTTT